LANARAQGLAQSANFGAPQQNSVNFAASTPNSGNNGATGFPGFGANNAFGGPATNSFPPAQPAAPSNTFSNSSFPAFGGSNQPTGFQPPSSSDFNFTAGGNNPFAQSTPSAPPTNGSTPAFGGAASMFGNNQQQSNPFGGLGQNNTTSAAPSGGMFGTSSSTPSGGMFGTSSAAPSGGMFGTTSGALNATSTPAPAATAFTFGAPTSSTQNTASTPATSGLFNFSGSTQSATPAQNGLFSGFGQQAETPKAPAAAPTNMFGGFGQKSEAPAETPKPQNNMFGGFGTSAQGIPNATATAPASTPFTFGQKADNAATPAPSTSLFGTSNAATLSTPAPTPASNPFANFPTASSTPSNPFGGFGTTSQTPQAQAKTPTASTNLFSALKKPEESSSTTAETPKPNPFAGLSKPASTPAATPAASSSGFQSIFGATQNKDATLKAPEAPKSSMFQPFSTPQPAKTNNVEASQGGIFTAAQPKTNSGIFSQTLQPETNNSSNLFKKPQSSFPSFAPSSTASTEASQATPAQKSPTKEALNPFSSMAAPSTDRPNLFSAAKPNAPALEAPAMTNLTGGPVLSAGPELPKIPKVHVPKEWVVPGSVGVQGGDSLLKQVSDLTAQLQLLNQKYREQLSSLPPTADWSSVSLWHHQHATDIKKKIDNAKKQRAAGKGITGKESSLSTKRKIDEGSPEARDPSPSKRARAADFTASPTPQPSVPTPKFNAPATATSNIFAKAIGNKPSTPATLSSTSTNLFAPKTTEKPSTQPSKPATPAASFGFTSAAPATNGFSGAKSTSSFGNKPSFGGDSASKASSAGFKPNFGSAPTSGSGGFFSQFTKTAKTYEELAAERKKKAMDEDYDSDEETKAQWSTRYDKAEAQRLAEEKKKIAATPKFEIPGATKPADAVKTNNQPTGSTSPKSNPFASLMKPMSGASTPGMSTPKAASPAPSTGSQSVFDAAPASKTPSSNIFGHLSSGPSSTNQDESDEDDGEQQEPVGSVEPATPKPRFGDSETESEDVQGESRQTKQNAGMKGSLLSRMSRDNDSESEKENSSTPSLFSQTQTNGTTTPANKPFQFFDFGGAGSKTAPPKTDTFAGDQTFKVGTPIKFGNAPVTEKKDAAPKFSFTTEKNDATPKFSFQPATPAASEFSTTPAKPPPFSLFNTGGSGGSSLFAPSGANSVTSSVFSSRAGTPLSEAGEIAGEASATSAAEDDEGEKHEQIDLSSLTPEETAAYDIVFHSEVCLAKHQVDKDGTKAWANLAKGPIWILKDKETGKCSVRVRIASGATPLNYQILPSLPATVTGASRKMVMATKPAKEGGLQSVLFAVKSPEIAEEMAGKYLESRPE
jgi:hypothetical protein